jgi:hypothetical protein
MTCAGDSHCATGFFCALDNTCQTRRAAGAPCNNNVANGNCAVVGCRGATGPLAWTMLLHQRVQWPCQTWRRHRQRGGPG